MAFSSTRSEIVNDLDYQNAPESVDSEILEGWVAAYRAGDVSVKDQLIRAHLRTVKKTAEVLASRYRKYNMRDDIVGEALMVMLDLIDSAQTELTDNQITSYIIAGVRYRLKDYIAKDRTVYMPGRTFRDKVAKGKEIKGLSFEACIISNEWENSTDFRNNNRDVTWSIPIAPPEEISPEFAEAMELAIVTEEERKVVDLRIAGSKYRDYEAQLGMKRDKVNRILKRVQRRFNSYYA